MFFVVDNLNQAACFSSDVFLPYYTLWLYAVYFHLSLVSERTDMCCSINFVVKLFSDHIDACW